jgi:REP element-mobilizing transposase RayT
LKKCVEGMIKLIALQKGWEIYELKVMPDHVCIYLKGISRLLAYLYQSY